MASAAEQAAMWRALNLAERGLGSTSPNPIVGCAILDRSEVIVGEGFHARAGGPHAEAVALAAAGPAARGGTAVVTLEPCDHTGRTGPCTQALIEAGIARVVIAVSDPDPRAGGGAATLLAAGIDVETAVLAEPATASNIAWLTAVRRGRPWVVWKFAATLDGRSAAADGTSRWITGEAARRDVHRLRAASDAVLVGSGTALADDPQLTVRDLGTAAHTARQPLRVVVDTRGRVHDGARVRDPSAPTWIATAAEMGRGVEGGVDLAAVLSALYHRGARSVLLEGGPTLAGAFLRYRLIDRVVAYLAPTLLGAGPALLGDAGAYTLGDAVRLDHVRVEQVGLDLKITARPIYRED